ncbi:hypothetical protein GGI12_005004, partial [Dipsacomyces acuminosporus]
MLIDFDNAIDTSVSERAIRPNRTGTLPFMSIGNLQNLDCERTELDDWESLLYIICWLGTFGINKDHRLDAMVSSKYPIASWGAGDPNVIGDTKRSDLGTVDHFNNRILK